MQAAVQAPAAMQMLVLIIQCMLSYRYMHMHMAIQPYRCMIDCKRASSLFSLDLSLSRWLLIPPAEAVCIHGGLAQMLGHLDCQKLIPTGRQNIEDTI